MSENKELTKVEVTLTGFVPTESVSEQAFNEILAKWLEEVISKAKVMDNPRVNQVTVKN